MDKTYSYVLPDTTGNPQKYETHNQSVIIIGANGSGKSKLGAWIEQQNFENVHRIGAQRNLNFNENLPLKNYQQAEDFVFYGSDDPGSKSNKAHRWNWGRSYTTQLLNDIENVLAALIALKNNENDEYVNKCKQAELNNTPIPHTVPSSVDKLIQIWNEIFPQRGLVVKDSKFLATINKQNSNSPDEYSSNQMSDGERAVLYLAAQVLCVPPNKTLIIDEPEVHFHRSIMNRLWIALEHNRLDCLFIYITHDTQFASMHQNVDFIWVKEYDGNNWKLERIENDNLPEVLLLDILGNRKDVLFVEGETGSYDTLLYQELFPNHYIIPCGSCSQVISRTKAFQSIPYLHHCKVSGIIDRDYRSDYEISEYQKVGIFTLEVAEVENLFLVQEVLEIIAEHMVLCTTEVLSKIQKYVVMQQFSNKIDRQICNSIIAQIKYKLSTAAITGQNNEEIKQALESAYVSIDVATIKKEEESKFQCALKGNDYKTILKIFNEKGIINSIGKFYNLKNNEYPNFVLRLLKDPHRQVSLKQALLTYFPDELKSMANNE